MRSLRCTLSDPSPKVMLKSPMQSKLLISNDYMGLYYTMSLSIQLVVVSSFGNACYIASIACSLGSYIATNI